jgi:hypothetical protein
MRTVFHLQPEVLAKLDSQDRSDRREQRNRSLSVLFMPLMGLAPGPLQRKWEREIGFPAVPATAMTAICEVAVGVAGVVQALAAAFGGAFFLPSWLMWLTVVGPVLMAVGLVRLASALSHGEPLGSPLGVPWLVVSAPERPPADTVARPVPRHRTDDRLDLWSSIHRADWTSDGVLGYRGDLFTLGGCNREDGGWLYRFERVAPDAPGPRLRLMPPRVREVESSRRSPSVFRTALVTGLGFLARAKHQNLWADRLGVRAVWFTLIGGAAELLGGMVNLRDAAAPTGPLSMIFNLLLVCDGSTRLALLAMFREPVGSLFGFLVQPLLDRLAD